MACICEELRHASPSLSNANNMCAVDKRPVSAARFIWKIFTVLAGTLGDSAEQSQRLLAVAIIVVWQKQGTCVH